jgi:LacI family transcriptional regulator
MITMADVAERCGVSGSTVSHVINGTRFVAEGTRLLVEQAIRDLGYTPNTIARSLAMASTKTIGLAISTVTNGYFAQLVAAMDAVARPAGYTLLMADTHDDPDEELRVVQALYQRRVDGLLLAPATGQSDATLTFLRSVGLPTVLVDRCPDTSMDQIGTANKNAMAQLTGHLADCGHRRIGMVSGQPWIATSAERFAGYRLGLRRAGIALDPTLVAEGGPTSETAQRAVAELLQTNDPPTALVTANDVMTIAAMRAAVAHGLKVPQDLAIAVFDDFEWADVFHPRLTAVAQPVAEIGRRSVDMLLARLEDPEREPQTVRISPTFIHRESCGCTEL